MFEGVDPGFVGSSYTAPDVLQDNQETINFYVEIDKQSRAKEPLALLGCPGLKVVLDQDVNALPFAGAARGAWVLPGGQQALYVVANTVYLVTILVPPNANGIATLQATSVGNLNTSAGPVAIRDNGVLSNGLGGYAVLVDGTFAYYYLLSGVVHTVTFTGGVQSGQATITLSTLPAGLIISSGGTLTDTSSDIPANTLITAVDTVGLTITMSANATGTQSSDTITLHIPVFGQITDPGFLGASAIAFIEGYLICNQPGTRTFFTTGPSPYQILFPGSFFALKDSSTDNIETLYENNRELWLVGERTSEVWYGSGVSANFYFSRIPGVGPQIGCAAPATIARMGTVLVWLASNEQGENIVARTNQYSWERISNHGVEKAISSYPVISDAIAYAYEDEGHLFYVLTFPTADVTWCYDASTGEWHKRLSYDPATGQFHRHRSSCFMNFADIRLVGDYQSGALYQMSRQFYSDAGAPLKALRRTPHVWQKENRERVFFSQLQIEFTPGVGLQTGQGENPQCMLRWSNDGGFTWGNEVTASIGKAGETRNRAIWYLLGQCRDRVWEFSITDPVQRDVIGATSYMEASA